MKPTAKLILELLAKGMVFFVSPFILYILLKLI